MSEKQYERKYKEDKPVVAICYDFDKTLSPDDMQAQGFIQSVGLDVGEFWKKSNELAESNDMDQNLAYMFRMKEEAEGRVLFTKDKLIEYGSKIELFPGVVDWFDRIRDYGKMCGVIVEHYIISSGLKEMIEGTSVARNGAFERIYANSFYYNDKGVAMWPAQVVNYTNKTQFLFRIEKGVLNVNDPAVNDSFPPEEVRVPFRNFIYIGDSDTDVPCMKLVNSFGGYSIGVYSEETGDKTKVYKMMREGRIKYFAPADYSEGAELDKLVKSIIERTVANEVLESAYYTYKKETQSFDKENNDAEKKKLDLILALSGSKSFVRTHSVVADMRKISKWSEKEKDLLYKIALDNSQVYYILKDADIKKFYEKLLANVGNLSKKAKRVKEIIEREED